jgi:hypothetical protein
VEKKRKRIPNPARFAEDDITFRWVADDLQVWQVCLVDASDVIVSVVGEDEKFGHMVNYNHAVKPVKQKEPRNALRGSFCLLILY